MSYIEDMGWGENIEVQNQHRPVTRIEAVMTIHLEALFNYDAAFSAETYGF